jgi:hypothetical protein
MTLISLFKIKAQNHNLTNRVQIYSIKITLTQIFNQKISNLILIII